MLYTCEGHVSLHTSYHRQDAIFTLLTYFTVLFSPVIAPVDVNTQDPPCRQIQGILTFEYFFCQHPHPDMHLCVRIPSIPLLQGKAIFLLLMSELPLGVNIMGGMSERCQNPLGCL